MEATTTTTTTTTNSDATTPEPAATSSTWEKIELKADELEDALERVIHEGSIRRIVVEREGAVIADFPLALGVVGAVLAAPIASIAAIVALVSDCTIAVERGEPATTPSPAQPTIASTPVEQPAAATA